MTEEEKTAQKLYVEYRKAEFDRAARITIESYIHLWMENVHNNLKHIEPSKSAHRIPSEPGNAYIVAYGPSLKMKEYKDDYLKILRTTPPRDIISVNKAYPYLIENGIFPGWLVALEALREPYEELLTVDPEHRAEIFMPVTVNPALVEWALKNTSKQWWFVPHMNENYARNVSNTWIETLQIAGQSHFGNVGGTAYNFAVTPLGKECIFLIAFDLSYVPDPTWTKAQSLEYRYYYNPELKETYAVSTVMEDYYEMLMDGIMVAKKRGVRTYNLTPRGPLPHREDIPNLAVKE